MARVPFERHVFVCINERPCEHPRGCCKAAGSIETHTKLKALVKERDLLWNDREKQRLLPIDKKESDHHAVKDRVFTDGAPEEKAIVLFAALDERHK